EKASLASTRVCPRASLITKRLLKCFPGVHLPLPRHLNQVLSATPAASANAYHIIAPDTTCQSRKPARRKTIQGRGGRLPSSSLSMTQEIRRAPTRLWQG